VQIKNGGIGPCGEMARTEKEFDPEAETVTTVMRGGDGIVEVGHLR